MSKLHYLIVLLVISTLSFIIIQQIEASNRNLNKILADEIAHKIELRIHSVYFQLLRYPNSAGEFQALVLEKLGLPKLQSIRIEKFQPGNHVKPATFLLKVGSAGNETYLTMTYYGCEYQRELDRQGELGWI